MKTTSGPEVQQVEQALDALVVAAIDADRRRKTDFRLVWFGDEPSGIDPDLKGLLSKPVGAACRQGIRSDFGPRRCRDAVQA